METKYSKQNEKEIKNICVHTYTHPLCIYVFGAYTLEYV